LENNRLLLKSDYIPGLQRHVLTLKQIPWINAGRLALSRQNDSSWIAGTGVIRGDNGLGERQVIRPRYFRIMHRPDDHHAGALHGRHAIKRVPLTGNIGGLCLDFRLGVRGAAGQECSDQEQNSQRSTDVNDFLTPVHLTAVS